MLPGQLSVSFIPITYITGLSFRLSSYVAQPISPNLAKCFDAAFHAFICPIWYCEYLANKLTKPLYTRMARLRTEILFNVSGEIANSSGLT